MAKVSMLLVQVEGTDAELATAVRELGSIVAARLPGGPVLNATAIERVTSCEAPELRGPESPVVRALTSPEPVKVIRRRRRRKGAGAVEKPAREERKRATRQVKAERAMPAGVAPAAEQTSKHQLLKRIVEFFEEQGDPGKEVKSGAIALSVRANASAVSQALSFGMGKDILKPGAVQGYWSLEADYREHCWW